MKVLEVFTDGGYKDNVGACAYIIKEKKEIAHKKSYRKLKTPEVKVTNNTMEMSAVITALNFIRMYYFEDCQIYINTDSQYVQKGITEWISKWERNGWRNAARKPVENKELWQRLKKEMELVEKTGHKICWQWVKGHSGNSGNELADKICTAVINRELKKAS